MSAPKLYYERGPVKIWHGDCIPWLATLEAGSVDCVVTDPPYGIGINKSHRLSTSRGFGGETWDELPCDPSVIEWILCREVPAIVWGGNYFDLPPARCVLAWDKMNDGRDFADFEQAWTNLDSVARMFRMRPMNMDGGKVHPTQKPVRLIEWCLALIGEAKTICDPFGGSFTTAVACIRTGRQFIGCELEERYCEIGAKRCDRELNQGRLPFAPPEPPAVQREMFE